MNLENGRPSGKSSFLAAASPLAMLTLMIALAFANAWPDQLVLDDNAFAGPGRAPELDSLQYIFTHDVWAPLGTYVGLYRPLLLLQLSLETKAFGDWLPGYHLSNIVQHLLVTLLLFGFLRFLLRKTSNTYSSSDLCALLAALVFAVHPIHTEVVNSVFNRSDIMVAFLGLGGLWWLLHHLDEHPGRAWFGLAITYFLAMLSKESAITIPALAVVLVLLVTPGELPTRLPKCLPVFCLILPLALYLVLRANALHQPELGDASQAAQAVGMPAIPDADWRGDPAAPAGRDEAVSDMFDQVDLPGPRTFLKAAAVYGQALKVFAWPYPLQLRYRTPPMPLLVSYAGLNLALILVAFLQFRRKRFGLVAGLAFFYLAMLPATRIISAGDASPHFAERHAYFSSLGLVIALAFVLSALAQRFAPRVLAGIAVPILLVLTALTWDRNADWRSEVALFWTEYQRSGGDENTLRWVASANLKARNSGLVVKICDENLAQQRNFGSSSFVQSCATAYEQQHRYEAAERAHVYAIKHKSTRIAASMSLARFYLRHARPHDAEKRFMAAIDWSNDPADKALNTAEMLINLNPKSREQAIIAKGHLEEALRLRPGWAKAETMLQKVKQALNSSPTRESHSPQSDQR